MVLNVFFIKHLNCRVEAWFCLVEQDNIVGVTPTSSPFQETRCTIKNDDWRHLLLDACMILAMGMVDVRLVSLSDYREPPCPYDILQYSLLESTPGNLHSERNAIYFFVKASNRADYHTIRMRL